MQRKPVRAGSRANSPGSEGSSRDPGAKGLLEAFAGADHRHPDLPAEPHGDGSGGMGGRHPGQRGQAAVPGGPQLPGEFFLVGEVRCPGDAVRGELSLLGVQALSAVVGESTEEGERRPTDLADLADDGEHRAPPRGWPDLGGESSAGGRGDANLVALELDVTFGERAREHGILLGAAARRLSLALLGCAARFGGHGPMMRSAATERIGKIPYFPRGRGQKGIGKVPYAEDAPPQTRP